MKGESREEKHFNKPAHDGCNNSQTSLLGEHSEREPPDPIPNSEVKPLSADDSVAGCHVKVGHRQALISKSPFQSERAFFCLLKMLWRLMPIYVGYFKLSKVI